MAIQVEPFSGRYLAAIQAFNQRLTAHKVHAGFLLPESSNPRPVDRSAPVFKEQYLAIDGEHVRGGYMVQSQRFRIRDQEQFIGNYQMPISEGLIDKTYSSLGMLLLRKALRTQPRMYALGMGSRENPLPRMLAATRWQLTAIPFLFHVCHPARFFRNVTPLRTTPVRRLALDALAASGLGWLGLRLLQLRPPRGLRLQVEQCDTFGDWADEVWGAAHSSLSFSAVRTREMLNLLYPQGQADFIRLKCMAGDRLAGWAVLLEERMKEHRYFGNEQVGLIVDVLAVPGYERGVAAAARDFLAQRGADLMVTNQAHPDWIAAFRRCSFLPGPSNYFLATSPALTEMLQPWAEHHTRLHVTRGDGEGPVNWV